MSFKSAISRNGNQWILPRLQGMNCEVTAFLNEHLFDLTDEPLWQQAVDSASYPGVKAVYLMPDTHLGYGIPVGGVVVTDDTIIQSGSGYDISCGVLYMKVPGLTAEAIATKEIRK